MMATLWRRMVSVVVAGSAAVVALSVTAATAVAAPVSIVNGRIAELGRAGAFRRPSAVGPGGAATAAIVAGGVAAVLLVWAVASAMDSRARLRPAEVSGPPAADELREAADRRAREERAAADDERRKAA
jgi:hypothetical protein